MAMIFFKSAYIPLKDMFTLTVGEGSQEAQNNPKFINSILFLSNLNKKIPN